MLSYLRRLGFWSLDLLRGGKVRKHYKDVKRRMTDSAQNKEQLARLLTHAAESTDFYSAYSPEDIKNFPIVTKNDIKGNYTAFYSKKYEGEPTHKMSTSGSTGTPFVIDWNMDKRHRQMADMIYFNTRAGQKMGQRYMYFRIWSDRNRKSRLEQWMQNVIPVHMRDIEDATLEKIRQRLKSMPRVNACVGYANTYEALVKYLRSKGDSPKDFKTRVFITSSEVLPTEAKQLIKETVGCSVVDRYANEENGFLAQTADISDIFKVNAASFFIEILREDSDEPCAIGEMGRVVVTDLYNFAVPMIRYDTGDLAIKWGEKDGWCTALKTIQGRRTDVIYDTEGKTVTSQNFGVYMWKFDKLKQYQFIQNGARKYTFRLNGAQGVYEDSEFISFAKEILGGDAEITIVHVDEIPMLKSGKFKRTVCEYEYNTEDYQ